VRQGELAARLQLEKSTVSRLVRQMEAHGWIQRNSDRDDGRAVLIRLTSQGRETATELARARQEKFARILAAIPEDKRSMVVEAISILERACYSRKEVPETVRSAFTNPSLSKPGELPSMQRPGQ
jgi:DNA-binding MarR family transcriptional regulator